MAARRPTQQEPTIDKKTFPVDLKMVYGAAAFIAYMVYMGTNRLNAIESAIQTLQATQTKQEKTNNEVSASIQTLTSMLTSLQADVKEIKTNTSHR